VAGLSERLFTRNVDLPEGVTRLPVKSVKINKSPALAPSNTLDGAAIERLDIDLDACHRHHKLLLANPDFFQRVATAYSSQKFESTDDVDLALYDGFFNKNDYPLLTRIRNATPQELAASNFDFHDNRLPELLFRYRARNWPETLTAAETLRWEQLRHRRLTEEDGGGSITAKEFSGHVSQLRDQYQDHKDSQQILDEIDTWRKKLLES